MELWRRGILLLGVILAVWLHFYVPLMSFVTVRAVDFAAEQKDESRLTDSGRYLAQLPLDEYVAEKTKDRALLVSGPQWESFFALAVKTSRGEIVPKEWARRVSKDEIDTTSYFRRIFFRTDKPPFEELASRLAVDAEEFDLTLETPAGAAPEAFSPSPRHLSIETHVMTKDDFHFGSGYMHAPKLPAWLGHPFRRFALPILLVALAAYIVLPRRRRPASAIYYPTWRTIIGDVGSFILFVPFFAIPMLVVGGSVQALTVGWILALICWPLALVGVWLLRFMAWYASYQVVIESEGLHLSTDRGDRHFRFSEMTSFQPIELKPPKWLIVLTAISAFFGRGGARAGAAGRSLMLASTAERGFSVKLADKSSVFFWLSSSFSGKTMKNAEKLGDAIKDAGVPWEEKVKSVTSISLPEGETPAGKIQTPGLRFLIVLFVLPLAALLVFTLLAAPGSVSSRTKTPAGGPEPAKRMTEPELEAAVRSSPLDADVEWEKTLAVGSEEESAYGRLIASAKDGGYFVAGDIPIDGNNTDAFLAKIDGDGRTAWAVQMGGNLQDFIHSVLVEDDGACFLAGETRPYSSILGKSDMFLARIDASGAKLWEKNLGKEDEDETAWAVRPAGKNVYMVRGGSAGKRISLRVDGAGNVLKEEPFSWSGTFPEEAEFSHTECTEDGGFISTGNALHPGAGFKELLLAKADARGELAWWKMFGGKKRESGAFVRATADGGYIAVGVSDSAGSGDDLYVVRTDGRGNLLWEKTAGGSGDQEGFHIVEFNSGGFCAVGTSKAATAAAEKMYLADLDAGGTLLREKTLSREAATYKAVAAAPAADGGLLLLASREPLSGYVTRPVVIKLKKQG